MIIDDYVTREERIKNFSEDKSNEITLFEKIGLYLAVGVAIGGGLFALFYPIH